MKNLGRQPFVEKLRKDHSRQWFRSVEALYKARINSLLAFASRHVYTQDLALDVVHDALVKSLLYFQKHPEKKVRESVVHLQILKACKRANRYSVEFASGLLNSDPIVKEDW